MKQIVILFYLSCFIKLNAQKASISTPLTQVMYIGMENPLDVFYPGVSKKDIVLKAHLGCSLAHGYPDFSIIPSSGNKTCSVMVGIMKGNVVKWADTIEIPVIPFPRGYALLGGFPNGDLTLSQVLACNSLKYYNSTYIKHLDSHSKIKGYRVLILSTQIIIDMSMMGAEIPQMLKDSFAGLAAGDIIMIDNIKAEVFKMEILLPPITIKLTEDYNPVKKNVEDLNEKKFKLDSLNDSCYFYESYYPDGKVYQRGKVLINTEFRSYSYQFVFDRQWLPIFEQPYEPHLFNVHDGYYPVSKWLVFDSTGRQKIEINYIATLPKPENINRENSGNGFIIVPDGECILYKPDGSIEKKIYYNKGIER